MNLNRRAAFRGYPCRRKSSRTGRRNSYVRQQRRVCDPIISYERAIVIIHETFSREWFHVGRCYKRAESGWMALDMGVGNFYSALQVTSEEWIFLHLFLREWRNWQTH